MSISSNFLNQGRDSHGWMAGVIGQKLPRFRLFGDTAAWCHRRIVVGGEDPLFVGGCFRGDLEPLAGDA